MKKSKEAEQSKKTPRSKTMRQANKAQESKRIEVDQYFLKIASVVAERSTCRRHHIGAVAVRDKHILTTGYNGAPAGFPDCLALGCLRDEMDIPSGERHEICRAVHAEQNVIIQAALYGVSLEGCTIYCTHTPCTVCAKMLVNVRIKRFVSYGQYNPSSYDGFINIRAFLGLFEEAGIQRDILDRPSSEITYVD
jgi:dCMP deaminase